MSTRRFLLDAWGRTASGYFGSNTSAVVVVAAAAAAATTTAEGLGMDLNPGDKMHPRGRLLYAATATATASTTTCTNKTSCEAKKIPQTNLKKRVSS